MLIYNQELIPELRTCDTDEVIQKYTPVGMKGNDLVVPVGPLAETDMFVRPLVYPEGHVVRLIKRNNHMHAKEK